MLKVDKLDEKLLTNKQKKINITEKKNYTKNYAEINRRK